MHWRAHAERMAELTDYDHWGGVVAGVRGELSQRVHAILDAGVAAQRVVLDPGLGFSKTAEQNWELLAGLSEIASLGFPLLVGASRKSFLGALLAEPTGVPRPVEGREAAHLAVVTMLAESGVWGVRVHEVRAAKDALTAWSRWRAWQGGGRPDPTEGAGEPGGER